MRRRVIIALLIAGGLVAAVWFWREFSIDNCLDHGGSWDYNSGECLG
jgi:hypothetical protein